MESGQRIILGIDPGLQVSGYSIMSGTISSPRLRECSVVKLSSSQSISERILFLHDFYEKKIAQCGVTDIALETPFLGKNALNFLKLGYIRGIIYLIAARHRITLHEFSPSQVKSGVTGYGAADKEQVARVLHRLFPELAEQKYFDATDALAIALCALANLRSSNPAASLQNPFARG